MKVNCKVSPSWQLKDLCITQGKRLLRGGQMIPCVSGAALTVPRDARQHWVLQMSLRLWTCVLALIWRGVGQNH